MKLNRTIIRIFFLLYMVLSVVTFVLLIVSNKNQAVANYLELDIIICASVAASSIPYVIAAFIGLKHDKINALHRFKLLSNILNSKVEKIYCWITYFETKIIDLDEKAIIANLDQLKNLYNFLIDGTDSDFNELQKLSFEYRELFTKNNLIQTLIEKYIDTIKDFHVERVTKSNFSSIETGFWDNYDAIKDFYLLLKEKVKAVKIEDIKEASTQVIIYSDCRSKAE